jgi:GT2 family glycosyltransferase
MGELYPMRTLAFFCVMLPRAVFERVGPVDENFGRGFFEDDDYCRRIEQQDLTLACADDALVHHRLSASFAKVKNTERQELFERNKAYYESKWGPWQAHQYRDAVINDPLN